MIIPLLKLNDEEQILAIEDPQELIYLSLDLMEKCQSETIKTCTVKLLHKLEHNVDGMLSFMVDFCLKLISHSISFQENNLEESKTYISNLLS